MAIESFNDPQKNKTLALNLEILQSREPHLYEKVLETEDAKIKERVFAEEKIVSLTFPDKEGKPLVFHFKETAQNVFRLTKYNDLKDYDVIVIEGFGLGEHIKEIIEATSEGTFILIIEQNIQFFKEIINHIDLRPILIERLSLSVNETSIQSIRKRLEDYFGVFAVQDIKIFRNPASIELSPEYYEEVDKQLAELSEVAKHNKATLKKFSGTWQRHILSNLKSVVMEPGVNELFHKFQGIPTILVGAGPSLDKNIQWIAGAQGKAIIMAVDTAFKTLLRYGIKPDFVLSLDAMEDNYRHLEGTNERETCLIANPVAYPSIIKEFCGPVFMMNFGDPLIVWIENFIGKKGETLSGGSIATSAFDLAYKLGSSPIILAGLDLSYTGGRAYTEWCYFDQVWLDEVSKFRTVYDLNLRKIHGDNNIYEKGMHGEEVVTSMKMFNWKRWFETMIKQFKICCVNSTEGGLEINGTEQLPLKEALNKYCKGKVDIKNIIAEAESKFQVPDVPAFIKHLEDLKTRVGRIGYLAKEGGNISSLILQILENSSLHELKLNSHLQKMKIFAEQILNEREFVEINKWCIETLLDKMKIDGERKGKKKDEWDIVLQSTTSYNTLFEGINEMCSHYDKKLDHAIGELHESL